MKCLFSTLILFCLLHVLIVEAQQRRGQPAKPKPGRSQQTSAKSPAVSHQCVQLDQTGDVGQALKLIDEATESIRKSDFTSLQDAKNSIIKRMTGLPTTVTEFGRRNIQGRIYFLEFLCFRSYGGAALIKDMETERSIILNGDAQADTAMRTVNDIDIKNIATLQEAKIKIESLHGLVGLVAAELDVVYLPRSRYQVRYCRDEKHGGLTYIKDQFTRREVALKARTDADKVLKIVKELKFNDLSLAQTQQLIRDQNFEQLGVVYAKFYQNSIYFKEVDQQHVIRFPWGEKQATNCAL